MKNFKHLFVSTLAAAVISPLVQAQDYMFREVPTGLSLFNSINLYSVTNSGNFLVLQAPFSGPGSAFIFNGSTLTAVPANPGDGFFAMNTAGYLVGYGFNGAFLQDPSGNQTLIADSAGDNLGPTNIASASNLLAGGAYSSALGNFGFLWENGLTLTEYVYPGASSTYFNGNNSHGDAVGNAVIGSQTLGLLYKKNGQASLFSIPNLPNIYPAMINNSGLIVGDASSIAGPNSGQLGFYITKRGKAKTFDVGDSAPEAMPGAKSSLLLEKPVGMTTVWGCNDLGWICGVYFGQYTDAVGGLNGYGISLPFVGQAFGN